MTPPLDRRTGGGCDSGTPHGCLSILKKIPRIFRKAFGSAAAISSTLYSGLKIRTTMFAI